MNNKSRNMFLWTQNVNVSWTLAPFCNNTMQQWTSTTLTGYKWFYHLKFEKSPVNGGKNRIVNESFQKYQCISNLKSLSITMPRLVAGITSSLALPGPNTVAFLLRGSYIWNWQTSRLRSFMIIYFRFQPTYPGSTWLALWRGCLGWERHGGDEQWVEPDNTMPGFPPHGACCFSWTVPAGQLMLWTVLGSAGSKQSRNDVYSHLSS